MGSLWPGRSPRLPCRLPSCRLLSVGGPFMIAFINISTGFCFSICIVKQTIRENDYYIIAVLQCFLNDD